MDTDNKSNNPVKSNHRLKTILIIPLLSCIITSCLGMLIGQFGNLLYRAAGDAGPILSIPCFLGLFLLTAAISFFVAWLLKKIMIK